MKATWWLRLTCKLLGHDVVAGGGWQLCGRCRSREIRGWPEKDSGRGLLGPFLGRRYRP